jgi:hypothetical protein
MVKLPGHGKLKQKLHLRLTLFSLVVHLEPTKLWAKKRSLCQQTMPGKSIKLKMKWIQTK